MSCVRGLFFLSLSTCLSMFCGCGVTSTTTAPVAAVPGETLAGNWLVHGALPGFATSSTSASGLVVNFDVAGGAIVGSASGETRCSSGTAVGFTYAGLLRGTVASDGSFTATTASNDGLHPVVSLTVQGTAPKAGAGTWTGTYRIASSGTSTVIGTACTIDESGSFTATAVGDVTGAYTGMGAPITVLGSVPMPIAITAVLQQNAPLYTANPAAAVVVSRLGLSGSVQLQGFPCFSHGTISTSLPSEVAGTRVTAWFVMDDGSSLQMLASIADTGSAGLAISVLEVRGGKCDGLYSFGPHPLMMYR